MISVFTAYEAPPTVGQWNFGVNANMAVMIIILPFVMSIFSMAIKQSKILFQVNVMFFMSPGKKTTDEGTDRLLCFFYTRKDKRNILVNCSQRQEVNIY
jgi:hypothetical protein